MKIIKEIYNSEFIIAMMYTKIIYIIKSERGKLIKF
jgi:hypothetical protein